MLQRLSGPDSIQGGRFISTAGPIPGEILILEREGAEPCCSEADLRTEEDLSRERLETDRRSEADLRTEEDLSWERLETDRTEEEPDS